MSIQHDFNELNDRRLELSSRKYDRNAIPLTDDELRELRDLQRRVGAIVEALYPVKVEPPEVTAARNACESLLSEIDDMGNRK
jgi:hypothetical protein